MTLYLDNYLMLRNKLLHVCYEMSRQMIGIFTIVSARIQKYYILPKYKFNAIRGSKSFQAIPIGVALERHFFLFKGHPGYQTTLLD
jgi:hypothetical protein